MDVLVLTPMTCIPCAPMPVPAQSVRGLEVEAGAVQAESAQLEGEVSTLQARIAGVDARLPKLQDEKKAAAKARK